MNTSTSAYLFVGGNSSFTSPRSNAPFATNLDNLPATFVKQGIIVYAASFEDIALSGPLFSVLLCDAQPKISGGRVRLENNGTVNVISSGQPPDGSFPLSAANIIFSNAFKDALTELETFDTELGQQCRCRYVYDQQLC